MHITVIIKVQNVNMIKESLHIRIQNIMYNMKIENQTKNHIKNIALTNHILTFGSKTNDMLEYFSLNICFAIHILIFFFKITVV